MARAVCRRSHRKAFFFSLFSECFLSCNTPRRARCLKAVWRTCRLLVLRPPTGRGPRPACPSRCCGRRSCEFGSVKSTLEKVPTKPMCRHVLLYHVILDHVPFFIQQKRLWAPQQRRWFLRGQRSFGSNPLLGGKKRRMGAGRASRSCWLPPRRRPRRSSAGSWRSGPGDPRVPAGRDGSRTWGVDGSRGSGAGVQGGLKTAGAILQLMFQICVQRCTHAKPSLVYV